MYSSVALLTLQKFNYKLALAKFPQRNLAQKSQYISKSIQPDAGFSLIEIITVVLMIGILAAMALPSWSAFVNRQRVGKANDAVLAAIQEAQRQAKQKKLSYSVSFKVVSQTPQIVIHPDSETASSIADTRWQPLGKDVDVQSRQITLLTNLSGKNKVKTSVDTSSTYLNTPQTISFDYMGTLPNLGFATTPTDPNATSEIKVVVENKNIKRCVILRTLLGATSTGKDQQCN
jgi:prepilin-type N-terminal cleavage/methylation domain-containing protein